MAVRVRFAALLHSYTGGQHVLESAGATVGEVLDGIDARCPGLAFRVLDEQGRVRPHMNVFVGEEAASDRETAVADGVELYIVGALSGG